MNSKHIATQPGSTTVPNPLGRLVAASRHTMKTVERHGTGASSIEQIHQVREWIGIAGNVIFGTVLFGGLYALVVFLNDLMNGAL